ncbi:MAG: hypothetical protein PF495_03470 [Spirochaetales bacterium]|jgi:wobble nucleotide-excising tRNase|nr:hypothetical protein [Spirochaetales bacterium]
MDLTDIVSLFGIGTEEILEFKRQYILKTGDSDITVDKIRRVFSETAVKKEDSKHICEDTVGENQGYGSAIDRCSEYPDGSFWVDNGEYASRVNFCPFCGKEAKEKHGNDT